MASALRKDIELSNIYDRAKQEQNGPTRVRILAIGSLLEDKNREHAAKIAGMSVSNLHVWIRRFNEYGLDGLVAKKRLGKKSTWSPECEQFLKSKALEGARFEANKRVTYRLEDFQAILKEKFGICYGISTIWYKLEELDLSWISVRQEHPKSDPVVQDEFKKKPPIRLGKYKHTIQLKK
ncbi:transposase [Candidatus Dependentiae bacterium]|nr:transposase [Candidatus Dependentiae bacterium]